MADEDIDSLLEAGIKAAQMVRLLSICSCCICTVKLYR